MKKIKPLALKLPALDFESAAPLALPDLGLVERPAPPPPPDDRDPVLVTIEAVETYETEFRARAKAEQERFALATDSRFWVCLCFETNDQKQEFLERMKLRDLGDKHIDGLVVAKRLGVPLKSPRAQWRKSRSNEGLAKLAKDD